jgi:hypothetical protein
MQRLFQSSIDSSRARGAEVELTSSLIGNARMMASGIVAVGHAQERGYAYSG